MPTAEFSLGGGTDDADLGHDVTSYENWGAHVQVGPNSTAGNKDWDGMWRFVSVTIPQGATINQANLRLTAYDATNLGSFPSTGMILQAEAIDSAAQPSAYDPDGLTQPPWSEYTSMSWTTAEVDWVPTVWTVDTRYDSPNIATVIQEVVDRAGWASGNAIRIRWRNDITANATSRLILSDSTETISSPVPATLYIDWTEGSYSYASPDADTATTGWSTAPLWSKIDDDTTAPDGTVITGSS